MLELMDSGNGIHLAENPLIKLLWNPKFGYFLKKCLEVTFSHFAALSNVDTIFPLRPFDKALN